MDSTSNDDGGLRLPSLGFSSFSTATSAISSVENDDRGASLDSSAAALNPGSQRANQEGQGATLLWHQNQNQNNESVAAAPRKSNHHRDEAAHHCRECSRPPSRVSKPAPLFLIPKEDGTTGMRRLRVLFVHGFESGPKGRRSVALGRHFECYTPWMREELEPILRWRRNRVVHACIALFLFLLALAFLIAYVTHHMGGLMVSVPALLVCLAGVYFVAQSVVVRFVAHPAIHGCLEKQRAAIRSFKPDVVVGSSWGGGIATYLMMEGAWNGPTVLLAPAGGIISRKARFLTTAQLHIPSSVGFVHVVHSKRDAIVPVKDTIDLVQRSLMASTPQEDALSLVGLKYDQDGAHEMKELDVDQAKRDIAAERIKLTVVEDDDHPLSRTMREEQLREAVLEAYTRVHKTRG